MLIHFLYFLIYLLLTIGSFISAKPVTDNINDVNDDNQNSYQIPTRQRSQNRTRPSLKNKGIQEIPTKKRTPNLTRPSSRYTLPRDQSLYDEKDTNLTEDSIKKQEKRPEGYYSRDQHAIRLAKSTAFRKRTGKTNYEDALVAAKEKLRLKKRKDNFKRREKYKLLGIKPQNYHTSYAQSKEGVIGRMTVHFLKERNEIFRHKEARKEAEDWYKKREKERRIRKRAAKAKREGLGG
jgi:hypothetical protein